MRDYVKLALLDDQAYSLAAWGGLHESSSKYAASYGSWIDAVKDYSGDWEFTENW